MDNAEKIRIVNERMKGNNVGVPKSLFKYRPFDKYAFDMLENNYLFLCQAAKLDDKSECSVSFDIKDYYDNTKRHYRWFAYVNKNCTTKQ